MFEHIAAFAAKTVGWLRSALTAKGKTILYFVPHQDDELLTLGIDACRRFDLGCTAHVFIVTDGSRSCVKNTLANGKECKKHDGTHHYELSVEEFVAARDTEFRASCAALGYSDQSVHFCTQRFVDGTLTPEGAEAAIRGALAQFPYVTEVCTISPFTGEKQHNDHRALGLAAVKLYNERVIKKLTLFVEPYCLEGCIAENPELELNKLTADGDILARIRAAIGAYSLWKPEDRRYAVGYHSVTHEFDDFIAAPEAHYHTLKRN